MRHLSRIITAAFVSLWLRTAALADVIPEPVVDPEPAKTGSVLPLVLIIAVTLTALAVLIVALRRPKR